ncbi:cytochrome P450, partial [Mycena rosella]
GVCQLDMFSILSRTSLEFIGRAGVGYSFDPLTSGEQGGLKSFFQPFSGPLLLPYRAVASRIRPPYLRRFALSLIPSKTLGALCNDISAMDTKAKALVRDKKQAVQNGPIEAIDSSHDIMSLLLKSNLTAAADMKFTDDELVAQISSVEMIIQAGTDVSSSALNRIVHVLALHPDVQEKLRAEIMETNEQPTHDDPVHLPYLDGVVRETLRLYPPITAMTRNATQDCILPLSNPITGIDGRTINAIPLLKETEVYMAIAAANHNKAIWGPDALEFTPQRWQNGRAVGVTVRMSGIYGNKMTFVGWGRSCIGFKFVQLELKVALSVLLRSFRFSVATNRIRWTMSSPASPTVDSLPLLPILVEQLSS